MNTTRYALLHTDLIVSVVSQYFEYQDDIYKFLFVNPNWAKMLVPVLWRSPIWKSPKSFQKFLHTLSEQHPPHANGTLVEKLTFKSYYNFLPPLFTMEALELISLHCPNVQYLTFDCLKPSRSSSLSYSINTSSDLPPNILALLLKGFPNLVVFKGPKFNSMQWLGAGLTPMRKGFLPYIRSLRLSLDWRDLSIPFLLHDIGSHCPYIVALDIITDVPEQTAKIIVDAFPNLTSFSCITVTFRALYILVSGLTKLTSLKLQFGQDITDDRLLQICSRFPKLESFSLLKGWDSLQSFIKPWSLIQQDTLNHLEFSHYNDLTNDMLLPIFQLCYNLSTLKLIHCPSISDSSITYLSRHRGCHFKNLLIHYNYNISDHGINNLAEHCGNLISFNLLECPKVTIKSLSQVIKQCRNLLEFYVSFNNKLTNGLVGCFNSFVNTNLLVFGNRYVCLDTSQISKTIDSSILLKLSICIPNLRKLDIRYPIKNVNPNAILNFKQLEKLCIVPPSNLKRKHLSLLDSQHKRLKEIWFMTKDHPKIQQYIYESELNNKNGIRMVLCMLSDYEEI
ncbi:10110_t:CDS:2 [Funneliformis geosporum]|uniref:10110_t:CDS:1 n=1 Tax=Funneliformis geosporum TaxID=1117311 RepID=A0A9W4SD00_9GLOM|nr:10110_t:CDS:2 [Funneliformis geosporum]